MPAVHNLRARLEYRSKSVHGRCRTGKKHFTDETLPPGTAEVTYLIQAIRSTATGRVASFTVPLGGGRRVGGPCAMPHAA